MKRLTIITGHYGSGKSEFSINLALQKKVDKLVDLDIVNPYFRSREVEDLLNKHNIEMISSPLKNALGSDLPYISRDAYLLFLNKEYRVIFDLGGSDVGARVLRQFEDSIDEDIDLLFCINVFREKTNNFENIITSINEIEASGGIKVTGLINNSNLLRETKCEDILYSQEIISRVAKELNLKIIYTAVLSTLDCSNLEGEVIPLNLYLRKDWL